MNAEILVTGALGNVGAEALKCLVQDQSPVRAGDLYPEGIQQKYGSTIEAVRFNFTEPATFPDAFRGIRRMFLMRPPQISNIQRDMLPALLAAREAGVRQVVFLSLIGIEELKRTPHFAVETYVKELGFVYTFLRSSFFLQNLNTTHRDEIQKRDEIFLPVGDARTSFIDARDIGEAAAMVLSESGHENRVYDLTGDRALDYYEVADLFTEALGRKITYRNPSAAQFFLRQIVQKRPVFQALIMTWLYSNTRKGMAADISGDIQKLLGRPPISVRQYIEDYREYWQRDGQGVNKLNE